MKVVLLEADGLADEPLTSLNGRTPLEQARLPHLDRMAERGIVGLSRTIPRGMPAGSEIGALSVMGYDPRGMDPGAAGFEAAGRGVELGDGDIALRLDLVRVEANEAGVDVVRDVAYLSETERRAILDDLARWLGREGIEFAGGAGGNGSLLVWRRGARVTTVSPYDALGKPVAASLPQGSGAEVLRDVVERARGIIRGHPVLAGRGDMAPNTVWPWGGGARPRVAPFAVGGAVVAGADLARGLGRLAGLDVVRVVGATGGLDTNLGAKAEAALRVLADRDFVLVHVKAVDAASHTGEAPRKIEALERLDGELVGPLLEGLRQRGGEWRVMVTAGHGTSSARRVHLDDPVPFAVYTVRDEERSRAQSRRFHERDAREQGIFIPEAQALMERLLRA